MALICPNTNTKEWKNMVKQVGEDNSYRLFVANDYNLYHESTIFPSVTRTEYNLGKRFNMNENGFIPSIVNYRELKSEAAACGLEVKKAVNGNYYLTKRNSDRVIPFKNLSDNSSDGFARLTNMLHGVSLEEVNNVIEATKRQSSEMQSAPQIDDGFRLNKTFDPVQLSEGNEKDQLKANVANKLIAFTDNKESNTAKIANAYGKNKTNRGSYTANDVVFLSAEGMSSPKTVEEAKKELDKAIEAGATIVTDIALLRNKVGNSAIEYVTNQGYVFFEKDGMGVLVPKSVYDTLMNRSIKLDNYFTVGAMTVMETDGLSSYIAATVAQNIIDKYGDVKVNQQQIEENLDDFIKQVRDEDFRELALNDEVVKTNPRFKELEQVVNNDDLWEKLADLVKLKMLTYARLGLFTSEQEQEADNNNTPTDDDVAASIKNSQDSKSSFFISNKNTLSMKMKKLLLNVTDYESNPNYDEKLPVSDSNPRFKKRRVFGISTFKSFDEVFNELKGILSDNNIEEYYKRQNITNLAFKSDFGAMINVLDYYKHQRPHLTEVINLLTDPAESRNDINQLRRQFYTAFRGHAHDLQYALIGVDAKGKIFTGLRSSSENQSAAITREQWKNNAFVKGLATYVTKSSKQTIEEKNGESKEVTIDEGIEYEVPEFVQDELDALIAEYKRSFGGVVRGITVGEDGTKKLEDINDYLKRDTEQFSKVTNDVIREFFSKLGINIDPATLDYIRNGGLGDGKTFKQCFEKKGLFGKIIRTFEKGNNDFLNSNPYDSYYMGQLAKVNSIFSKEYFASTGVDVMGKGYYAFGGNNYASERLLDLKTNPNLRRDLANIPFTSQSYLMDNLSDMDELSLGYVDGVVFNNNGFEQVRNKLETGSTNEYLLYELTAFHSNNGNTFMYEGRRKANMLAPSFSNKSKLVVVKNWALHDVNKEFFKQNGGDLDAITIDTLYQYLVLPEIRRIQSTQEGNENRTSFNENNYQEASQLFFTLPFLNLNKNYFNGREIDADGNITSLGTLKNEIDIQHEIKQELRDFVMNEITKHMESLNEITEGKGIMSIVNDVYNKKMLEDFKTKKEKDLKDRFVVTDLVVNSMLFNAEFMKMFAGDPAMAYNKKGSNITNNVKLTLDNMHKRMAGIIANGSSVSFDGLFDGKKDRVKILMVQDRKVASKYIDKLFSVLGDVLSTEELEQYANIDTTDGQVFESFDEYISNQLAQGLISEEQYHDLLKKEESSSLSRKDLSTIFGAKKPVHYTSEIDTNKLVEKRWYEKSSAVPLIRQLTRSAGQIDEAYAILRKSGADKIDFASAMKLGGKNHLKLFNDDGNINPDALAMTKDELSNHVMDIPRKNYYIQQENPYKHDSMGVTDGTQQNLLIFNNIRDLYIEPNVKSRDLESEYLNLYRDSFSLHKDRLYQDLDVKEVDGKVSLNYDKLSQILLKEADSRGFTLNERYGLKVEKDRNGNYRFVVPLFLSSNNTQYQFLLKSIVDNRVRKMMMNGQSFVLQSEAGYSAKRGDGLMTLEDYVKKYGTKGIIYTDNYDPNIGLKPNLAEQPAQVFLPFRYIDNNGNLFEISKLMKDGKIDSSKLPSELLRGIGYRVPSAGQNSMAAIEVAGFLPDWAGNIVIAPADFVKQMGSDFDIDKLNIYLYNLQFNDNKTPEQIAELKAIFESDEYKSIKATKALRDEINNALQEALSGENYNVDNWSERFGDKGQINDFLNKILNDGTINQKAYNSFIDLLERNNYDKDFVESLVFGKFEVETNKDKSIAIKLSEKLKDWNNGLTKKYQSQVLNRTTKKKLDKNISAIYKKIDAILSKVSYTASKYQYDNYEGKRYSDKVMKDFGNSTTDGKRVIDDQIRHIENALLDIRYRVLTSTNPEVQAKIKKTTGYGENLEDGDLDKLSKEIAAYTTFQEKTSMYTPSYQRNKYLSSQSSLQSVAVFASNNTLLGLLNYTMDEEGNGVDNNIKLPFTKGGMEIFLDENEHSLSYNLDRVGNLKSDNNAAVLSGSLDDEKNQFLGKLNVTEDTYGIITYLINKGLTLKDIFYFINQPVFLTYKKNIDNGLTQRAALTKTIKSFGLNADDATDLTNALLVPDVENADLLHVEVPIDLDELEDFMVKGNKTKSTSVENSPESQRQLDILRTAYAIKADSQKMFELNKRINTKNKGIPKFYSESIDKQRDIMNLGKDFSSWDNVDRLLGEMRYIPESDQQPVTSDWIELGRTQYYIDNKPTMCRVWLKPKTINGSAIAYGLVTHNNLWKELYPNYFNDNLTATVERVLQIGGFNRGQFDSYEAYKNHIWNSIKMYSISNKNALNFNEELEDLRDRLLNYKIIKGKVVSSPLAVSVLEAQNHPQLKDNYFLKILKPSINKSGASLVRYSNTSMYNIDDNYVHSAFTELLEKPVEIRPGYTSVDLAEDIISYGMYVTGYSPSRDNFNRFIPMDYLLKRGFGDAMHNVDFDELAQLVKNKDYWKQSNGFIEQYIQNNHDVTNIRSLRLSKSTFNGEKLEPHKLLEKVGGRWVEDPYDESKGRFTPIESFKLDDKAATNESLKVYREVYNEKTKMFESMLVFPEYLRKDDVLFQYIGENKYVRIDNLGSNSDTKQHIYEYDNTKVNLRSVVRKNQAKNDNYQNRKQEIEDVEQSKFPAVNLLNNLAKKGTSSQIRTIAKEFLNYSRNRAVNIVYTNEGKYAGKIMVEGAETQRPTIYIDPTLVNRSDYESRILEEFGHVVTAPIIYIFNNREGHGKESYNDDKIVPVAAKFALKRMESMFNDFKTKLGYTDEYIKSVQEASKTRALTRDELLVYPFTNMYEFSANVFSNPVFREFLKGRDYVERKDTNGFISMLQAFFSSISDLLNSLGILKTKDALRAVYEDSFAIMATFRDENKTAPVYNEVKINKVNSTDRLGTINAILPKLHGVVAERTLGTKFQYKRSRKTYIGADEEITSQAVFNIAEKITSDNEVKVQEQAKISAKKGLSDVGEQLAKTVVTSKVVGTTEKYSTLNTFDDSVESPLILLTRDTTMSKNLDSSTKEAIDYLASEKDARFTVINEKQNIPFMDYLKSKGYTFELVQANNEENVVDTKDYRVDNTTKFFSASQEVQNDIDDQMIGHHSSLHSAFTNSKPNDTQDYIVRKTRAQMNDLNDLITNAEKNRDYTEAALLRKKLINLEKQIEGYVQYKTFRYINSIATTSLNEVERVLTKDGLDNFDLKNLNYVNYVLDTWDNTYEKYNSNKSTPIQTKTYLELQERVNELKQMLAVRMESAINTKINLLTGKNIKLSDEIKTLRDINWAQEGFLDLSKNSSMALQSLVSISMDADTKTHNEYNDEVDELETLVNEVEKTDKNWEDKLMQKWDDGKRTGDFIHRYNQEYFDLMHLKWAEYYALTSSAADKAKKRAHWKWYNSVHTVMDANLLLDDSLSNYYITDGKTDEEKKAVKGKIKISQADFDKRRNLHIEELKEALGEKGFSEKMHELNRQVSAFKDEMNIVFESIENDDLTDVEKELERKKWLASESPFVHTLSNPRGIKLAGVEKPIYPKGHYVIRVPKKFIRENKTTVASGFYNDNFKDVEDNEALYKLYSHILTKIEDYSHILPANVARGIQPNMMPTIRKALGDVWNDNKMSFASKLWEESKNFTTFTDEGLLAKVINPVDSTDKSDEGHARRRVPIRHVNELNDEILAEYVKKQIALVEVKGKSLNIKEKQRLYKEAKAEVVEKEKSMDIKKAMKAFMFMSLNYKYKNEISDYWLALEKSFNESQETKFLEDGKTPVLDADNDISKKTKEESFKKIREQILKSKNAILYGVKHNQEEWKGKKKVYGIKAANQKNEIEDAQEQLEDAMKRKLITEKEYAYYSSVLSERLDNIGGYRKWHVVLDRLIAYLHLKQLGWGIMTAVNNMSFGFIDNVIEASGGQTVTLTEYRKAFSLFRKADVQKKLSHIIKRNDLLHTGIHELYDVMKLEGKAKALAPFATTQATEYVNQAPNMLAIMEKTMIEGYENVSVFDALDEQGKWNTEKYGEEQTKLLLDTMKVMRQYTARVHGNYDSIKHKDINHSVIGRALMTFRNWMPESIAKRWETEHYDSLLGTMVKGRWQSYGSYYEVQGAAGTALGILKELGRKLLFTSTKFNDLENDNFNEVDAANMRKNMTELLIYGSILTSIAILKSMKSGEDDKKRKAYYLYVQTLMTRLQTDTNFYISPMGAKSLTQNTLPVFKIIIDFQEWFDAIGKYAQGKDEIKTGVNAHESRLQNKTYDLFPLLYSFNRERNVFKGNYLVGQ